MIGGLLGGGGLGGLGGIAKGIGGLFGKKKKKKAKKKMQAMKQQIQQLQQENAYLRGKVDGMQQAQQSRFPVPQQQQFPQTQLPAMTMAFSMTASATGIC